MKAMLKPGSVLFGLAFAAAVVAQPALYVEGTHYEVIAEPVRTDDPNKIEVTEVFWYGSPQCYAFGPLIESWLTKLPADVNFVRSPGMWDQLMEVHARVFYAAKLLGVLDKVHPAAFTEIHQKRNYLQTTNEVKTLFIAQGVSAADFDKTWASFAVTSAVKKADTRMRGYGVRGVPALIVNGKYLVTGDSGTTQADQLKIADFLIKKERSGT